MAAAVVMCLAGASAALAVTGTLDQSQTKVTGSAAVSGPVNPFGTQSDAQTFTAGLSGRLDRVSLALGYNVLGSSSVPGHDLTVDITAVGASGAPDMGRVLATSGISKSKRFSTSAAWYRADFASPATVRAGEHYAIVAYAAGSDEYDWFGADGNPYAGGEANVTGHSPPTSSSSWAADPHGDFAFKTYVETTRVLAAKLRSATRAAVGRRNRLFRKAKAIQRAVDTGRTAAACTGINRYLALVKVAGRKLTKAQRRRLKADAKNLAAALGCR